MGEVLAAEDLDGGQVTPGRHDLARDHVTGLGEEVLLAFPAPGEGDQERVPGAPPRAARALHVAGRAARHRREDDRGQVADVDAEFQGGGAGQDVRVVVPGAVAEGPLYPFPLGAGHGADVLGGDHLVRLPLGVELTVVVLLVLPVGHRGERPGAPVPGARLADPVGTPFRVGDLLPMAGVAAERRARDLRGLQQPDPDVTGPQPVDPGGAVAGGPHREHVLVREELQQPGQVERRLLRADPEAAGSPVHVPALTGVRRVELAAPLALASQEPGRRDTAGERGHAVLASSPDRAVPFGSGDINPVLQPVVGDAAAHPEPLQDAPDQDHVPVRARQVTHRGDGAPELQVLRERGDPRRVRQRDLDGGGPGELQGAAHPGAEPELQDHLEGQPLGDQPPRVLRPGALTREQPVHVLAAVQVRRDHGGQPLRARSPW